MSKLSWAKMRVSHLVLMCLMISVATLHGCSVVEVKTTVTYQGKDRQIPENIINATVKGLTDKAWLIDHIGYPDQIIKKGSAKEHYVYKYSEIRQNYTSVLLLYSNEYSEHVNTDVVFEIEGNIVKNYWSEEVAPEWDSPKKKLTDEEVLILDPPETAALEVDRARLMKK